MNWFDLIWFKSRKKNFYIYRNNIIIIIIINLNNVNFNMCVSVCVRVLFCFVFFFEDIFLKKKTLQFLNNVCFCMCLNKYIYIYMFSWLFWSQFFSILIVEICKRNIISVSQSASRSKDDNITYLDCCRIWKKKNK